ncbi:MAG: tyrosine-type recombinase/integrase [Euryarchaeota archaeon]|nr:tyrosine-type recombinase/integrase [Euryarchaeota archaeon]
MAISTSPAAAFHQYDKRLTGALQRLEKDDILEANRQKIREFIHWCQAEGLSAPRIVRITEYLRDVSRWLEGVPFEAAAKKDMVRVMGKLETSPLAQSTKHACKAVVKKFWRWLKDTEEDPPETKWIRVGPKGGGNVLPEALLTEEEVRRIIEAAQHPRDKALVATLYESGCRIGEICTLQIKHLAFEQAATRLIVSGKTGMRRVLLIASTPYLASWLDYHPFKTDPEAPLWTGIGPVNMHQPLNYPAVQKILRQLAERAGVKKRVNPHSFRHARATTLAKDLTEAQLNQVMGWTPGSRMAGVYTHLSGRDTDGAIRKLYGMEEAEQRTESPLKPQKCPRCELVNTSTARFCNRCGAALDLKTALEREARLQEPERKMGVLLSDEEVQEVMARRGAKLDVL